MGSATVHRHQPEGGDEGSGEGGPGRQIESPASKERDQGCLHCGRSHLYIQGKDGYPYWPEAGEAN